MKKWISEYLCFTLKERVGIFILLVIILVFLCIPTFYQVRKDSVFVDTALLKLFQTPEMGEGKPFTEDTNRLISSIQYFHFDPNSIGEKEWQLLGLRPTIIRTIKNYLNKGGRFDKPTDIRKIWGLEKSIADALIPYIDIQQHRGNYFPSIYHRNNTPITTLINDKASFIDINTASVKDWELLPGIGSVLAARIIKFREKLGGFTAINQVLQTYGIKDSVFQRLKPQFILSGKFETTEKPNINTASATSMKLAGLSNEIADAIVNYRKQYGQFKALNDLKRIAFVNDSVYQKITQFLQF